MKITQIVCPSCGGRIDADGKRTISFCEFCGNKISIETAQSVGYDMEYGRLNARADVVQALAAEVLELTDPLCNLSAYKRNQASVNNRIDLLSRQIRSKENGKSYMPYLWPIVGGGFAFLFLMAVKANILVFLIFAALIIGSFYLSANNYLSVLDNLKAEIEQRKIQSGELDQRIESCNEVLARHHNVSIPEKYRNKDAMAFIYNTLQGQGAFSLEEAITKYELQKQQKQLMDMQAKQIELQKQQIQEMKQLRKETRRGNVAKGAGSAAAAAGTAIVAHEVIKQIRRHM